jgi:isopenicillin-N N-acyltransferase-like protein
VDWLDWEAAIDMAKIPLFEVSGSHREVGLQIGRSCQAQIRRMLAGLRADLPTGVSWEELRSKSGAYLATSQRVYPRYIEELQGVAEGAEVPFEDIFISMCEELWEQAAWRQGCTDMAARGKATVDGSTLIAHTNDLLPESEGNLVILKVTAANEPTFLAVSASGVGISAGFNAAGISLTGNQVDQNDIRAGVPRLMGVRAILVATRLGEAMDACLLPERASSYNNVIADAHGEVYSMEGSATACEPIYIEEDILAHANHYVHPAMVQFEADRNAIGGSVLRHNRAMRLLRENYGRLSPALFQELLADHANYPASICKHGTETVTVFSIIVQTEQRRAWIGRGRACETEYHEYRL